MVSLLLVCVAAILNSVMDSLFDDFGVSIFKNLNERFWNPMVSWKYCKVIPIIKYPIDAWHITKTLMLLCFCFAIVLYKPISTWYGDILIFGMVWNIVFDFFFNKIV